MRILGRCLLGVLAVALRQPDSTQVQYFKRALPCVGSLLDFSMMAQYRSHTDETIQYMEDYANRFHEMKDIFLEFRISKQTKAKADELRKALRPQRTLVNQSVARSRGSRVREQLQNRQEENDQCMDLIHAKSHFNFIEMHLIIHFREHIYQFGNIPMYSTEFGDLAHKEQIKDGYRRSNKIDAARQILRSYGRHHAIRMRLLNLESLRRTGADRPAEVVEHLEKTRTAPVPPAYHRILKGRRDDIRKVADFSRVSDVSLETICRELIHYSRLSLPLGRRLPEDVTVLRSLPVELMTTLEIPVIVFQETDVYDIHRARCTGTRLFRNQASSNDCVWIQVGGEQMYGALRGHLPAKLLALFKIRDYTQQDAVYRLAGVQLMNVVNSGRPSDVHSLVTGYLRDDARELTIVDIGTILGLAHLILKTDRRWLVNSRIDLRTFNEIY